MAKPTIYNVLVTVQSPGGTRDAVGERTTTWTDVAQEYVSLKPVSTADIRGRADILAAGQMHATISHRIRMRFKPYMAALDSSWRIAYGARIFIIVGLPRNVDEDSRILEIDCEEGKREE